MKNITIFLIITVALAGALLLANPPTRQNRSAEVLLGAALHQEEVEGNLEAAIETYKKILAEYPNNRPLAAKALLQIGQCYEKLGKDEARKAYERLLRDYADQSEQAKLASARLAALRKSEKGTVAGMVVRKVWSEQWTDTFGAPSPDGRYLSYVDWQTGDLAVRDLQTGKNRRLTDKGTSAQSTEFALFSRWSPDGKQLVYDWYQGSENTQEQVTDSELRIVGLDASKPRVFYTPPKGFGVDVCDWSEDGKHILAVLGKKDRQEMQLVSISVADGSATVLKKPGGDWGYSPALTFSPDGRYVLYDNRQSEGDSQRDVFLLSTEGRPETRLVEHPADDYALGWTPDGKSVLFASDRTGSVGIWAVSVAEGKAQGAAEMVRAGAGDVSPMGFTRDGSYFYSLGSRSEDIYVAELDPQSGEVRAPAVKLIRSFEGHNTYPQYSRDGKRLAYISGRGGGRYRQSVLCIRSLETGNDREFPTEFERVTGPRWLPDGRAVIIAALDRQQHMSLCKIDLETGNATRVVVAGAGETFARHEVSPDGKVLYYVKVDTPRTCRLLRRSLETGDEKELYAAPPNELFSIALSPDGHQLAFLNQPMKGGVNERLLRVIPATGGEPTEIFRFKHWGQHPQRVFWSADGKYLLFPRQPANAPDNPDANWSLWRIPARGGDAEKLALETHWFGELSIHPGGRRIAFQAPSSERAWDEVWVMENFLPPVLARPSPTTLTARRLENPPADTPSGAVSLDGRYLSFWDWHTGALAVRDLQTGKDRRLTNEGTEADENSTVPQQAGKSTWSPDSKHIAYAWYIGSDARLRVEARVVGLDGGKPRVLSQFGSARELGSFVWSPDGKQILASVYPKSGLQQMVLISTADGSTRVLTDIKREISPTTASFSPDGRYVAYDRLPDDTSPERDIFLMSIDSGQATPLIQHPADDYLLGWSADGKWIVFASDRTGALGLWVVGMSGAKTQGEPQLVKPGIDRILPMGLTREGALYYGVVRATEDVYIADLDPKTGKVTGSPRRAIERYEGGNFSPSYSPDGKYLAYESRRGNSPYPTNHGNALCIRSLDKGQERVFYREIWRLGLRYIGRPRWSPDGRFISFAGGEGIWFTGVYRIDLETSEITRILRCGPDELLSDGEYGPNGKHFFARANSKEGFSQIVVRDLESGEERELYRFPTLERGIGIALSPDGRWLSFINAGWGAVRSLRIMPASGRDAREVWSFGETKQGTPGGDHTWTPDERYILFSAPDPSDLRVWDLWRVPVEGGKPEKMGLQKRWGIGRLTVRPDGRGIAFANRGGASTDSEIWVMENFLPRAGSSK
jgi:Tol biopolymer transport system component